MIKRFLWLLSFSVSITIFAQKSQTYTLSVQKSIGASYITQHVKVDSLKSNPFIGFSVALKGVSINTKIDKVYFKNSDNEWQVLMPDENNDEKNAWYALVFLSEDILETQLKIDFTTPANLESIKLNFYFPDDTENLLKKYNIGSANVKSQKILSDCGCPRPTTITRQGWCPDGSCYDNPNPAATDVKFLIVHHTAGSNTSNDWAAVVRSIWNYHVYTRGWDDIGYNFLIDTNGNIYEGRADDTRGAHFSGHNSETSGMALMGTFTSVTPSSTMLYALEGLLVWKCCDKEIDPLTTAYHASSGLTLNTISGHRDGGATECPGDKVYELLPTIRNSVDSQLTSCALGVDDEFAKNFVVYPNPFTDTVTILLNNAIVTDLEINCYDLHGRLIFSRIKSDSSNKVELDVSNLSSGLYVLRLASDEKQTYTKLIKN
ncbi:MAG: N-acetylmuramoyl-L-alanine amidase [Flavobacteriaceae bacterium]|nr:N-acetylmuramoyl-L-alanine amidase [Flavobacteriaceae bacterium]